MQVYACVRRIVYVATACILKSRCWKYTYNHNDDDDHDDDDDDEISSNVHQVCLC